MSTSERKTDFKADLLRRLHDPTQLRILVTGLALVIGYVGIYLPLDGAHGAARLRQSEARTRLELSNDTERLRVQVKGFAHHLPLETDPNEWVEYVLGGIRSLPIKLVKLEAAPPRTIGPYKVVVLRIVLEGTFKELNNFLLWLDGNERLLRVDAIKLEPDSNRRSLTMQLTVLGMMG
jgi:hypothetical protein